MAFPGSKAEPFCWRWEWSEPCKRTILGANKMIADPWSVHVQLAFGFPPDPAEISQKQCWVNSWTQRSSKSFPTLRILWLFWAEESARICFNPHWLLQPWLVRGNVTPVVQVPQETPDAAAASLPKPGMWANLFWRQRGEEDWLVRKLGWSCLSKADWKTSVCARSRDCTPALPGWAGRKALLPLFIYFFF